MHSFRQPLIALAAATTLAFAGGAFAQGGAGGGSGAPSNNAPGTPTNNAGNPKPGMETGTAASGAKSTRAMKPKRSASGAMGAGSSAGGKGPISN